MFIEKEIQMADGEDYEKRNFGECMTCAGFFTATLAAIGAVLLIGATAKEDYMSNIFLATACMIMLIPAAVTTASASDHHMIMAIR